MDDMHAKKFKTHFKISCYQIISIRIAEVALITIKEMKEMI